MSKSKKYYWLKLKDNFFEGKAMKKLRKIAGGDTYTIIYLKLLLKSMKTDGKLYFDGIEETFCEELALDIDEDTENVKITVMYLQKVGLLKEVNEKEIELIEMKDMVGSESDSAERVRRMRTKKKLLGEPGIDEKRYGGNGLAALERDNFKCVKCGSDKNICIHHQNGFSNNLDDLTTLCRKCHASLSENAQVSVTCNGVGVTCNTDVTKCNTEKEIEKEIEKDIDIEKEINKERKEKSSDHFSQNDRVSSNTNKNEKSKFDVNNGKDAINEKNSVLSENKSNSDNKKAPRINEKLEFEKLWTLYPRKQGKKAAYAAFTRARKSGVALDTISSGIKAYVHYIDSKKISQEYIKQGSTFFNQHSWDDDWTVTDKKANYDIEAYERSNRELFEAYPSGGNERRSKLDQFMNPKFNQNIIDLEEEDE